MMKMRALALAAALVLTSIGGAPALAKPGGHQESQWRDDNGRRDTVRNDDRGRRLGWRNGNNGRHLGWRNHHRRYKVCRNVWRHHHRQRVCSWRWR
jgi:hypothetical protein